MKTKQNVIGEVYGKLKIVSEHSKTRNGHYRYTCECECGNIANILLTHLRQGNTKSCGCDKPIGNMHPNWKGYGDISGDFWFNHIVRSARGLKGRRNPVELSITIEDSWNLFLMQDKKCALSGLKLTFPKSQKDKSYTASLDRIDSSKGYTIDNVQWVHKDINIMKNKYSQNYFINMCKLINEYETTSKAVISTTIKRDTSI
jgi:hypothetical protein